MTPVLGVALATVLAGAAWALRWLTAGGAITAALVGGAVFTAAGMTGAFLLALFFTSGSLLTYSGGSGGRPLAPERERSGRTASQVLANGLWAAGGAVLIDLGLEPGWVILTAALAAAQADTWATEIGIRAGGRVRLITSGQVVSPGTSGGVSVAGTAGGAAGAAALSGLYLALGGNTGFAGAAFLGGTIGMLTDSVLGATLQGRYYCEHCAAHTEEATHTCGRPARRIRGVRWLDNDGVNLVATGVGALSALGFAVWI